MKKLILGVFAISIVTLTACNNKTEKSASDTANQEMNHDGMNHDMKDMNMNDSASATNSSATAETKKLSQPIIANYLNLKKALASDDAKSAASAAKQLQTSVNSIDMKSIPADIHGKYMTLADKIADNAKHIADNAGNIAHQREQFSSLSGNIGDLISLFGTSQTLYKDFCPMYNDGKGAAWFSESKEIKNPYFGSEMPTCGEVKEVIK